MIVTSSEESIQAIRYTPETCINAGSLYLNPIVAGQIETLYRKTSTTNFVYGTTIKTDDTFRLGCRSPWCGQYRALKPHELYKERIYQIFFDIGKKEWACPEHRKQESVK